MTSVPTPQPLLPASALLDQPALTAAEVERLGELCGEVLQTRNDIVLFESEAILALEAVARNIAGPGICALNVVTGPYGGGLGEWMRQAGADVTDVTFAYDDVAHIDDVVAAIDHVRPHVVALVHAEAATGGTNDVAAIASAARNAGAVTVVDTVAAIGAEELPTDAWGVDIVAFGAQKALAGPIGISAVSVSDRAWELIDANASAPRGSILSMTDWRDSWLRSDHSVVPGYTNTLEARALIAALERVLAEGLDRVNARHSAAAAATRAAAATLGIDLWQNSESAGYAPIATALRIPGGPTGDRLRTLSTGLVTQGVGSLQGQLIRVNHFGLAASLEAVTEAISQLANTTDGDATAAIDAATAAWNAAV